MPAIPVAHARLLPDLLRIRAASEPGRVALRSEGGPSITYGEWDRRSNAFARGLIAQGARRGDRVGLYFNNSSWADFGVAYLGSAKAATIAVPLSDRFAEPQLRDILARAGVTELITGSCAAPAPTRQHSMTQLESGQSLDYFQAPADSSDVVEVLYTSGTTGLPKGVACTHDHVVRPLDAGSGWPPDFWRHCAGGVYLHANSLSTAAGQLRILDALGPERMTMSALPVFDPDRMCQAAAEQRAAVIQLVPGMALAILDTGAAQRHDLSSVQVVSLGCAAFPAPLIPRLAAAFPNATLVNLYELSEARHMGTAMIHDGVARLASVGRPRGQTQIRITNLSGDVLPAGEAGEVRLRWPGLGPQHYYADPAASVAVFGDGWTRTGDAGYLDSDGYLFIVDRIKDIIIKGGTSIASQAVEAVLLTHPAVAETAVFGVPDPFHGELVCAAVVLRTPAQPGELRAFASRSLAQQEVPDRILIVAELPRNRSGKVLKRELRDQAAAPACRADPGRAEDTGEVLALLWADILHRDRVGSHDDFFALGGDSLQASQVSARLRAKYGIELPVATIFEYPRLADLAAAVGELVRAGPDAAGAIPQLTRPAVHASDKQT